MSGECHYLNSCETELEQKHYVKQAIYDFQRRTGVPLRFQILFAMA